MLIVETIGRIRREHFVNSKSIKEIARDLKISKNTVRKVLRSEEVAFTNGECNSDQSWGNGARILIEISIDLNRRRSLIFLKQGSSTITQFEKDPFQPGFGRGEASPRLASFSGPDHQRQRVGDDDFVARLRNRKS
jgi:hypothetical protein